MFSVEMKTSLFRDLYVPAVALYQYARDSVPPEKEPQIAELELKGQKAVIVPLQDGARARCVVSHGQHVVELGTSKVEGNYWELIDSFKEFGCEHLLHREKVKARHREGALHLVVIVVVGENRVRLVSLKDDQPGQYTALFELTGTTENKPVVVH